MFCETRKSFLVIIFIYIIMFTYEMFVEVVSYFETLRSFFSLPITTRSETKSQIAAMAVKLFKMHQQCMDDMLAIKDAEVTLPLTRHACH